MKTRERLLFMALDGLLVLAGMTVGQFVFSPVQAQGTRLKTVRQWKVRSRNGGGEPDDELILGELDVNVAMM
jgi:hypothetical protein